jgi:hypothetical protein
MSILLDGLNGITTPAETVQGALTTTGNTILGDATTDTLNVGNGGLVKDASGNVGIGTASPIWKLHAVATDGIVLVETNAASAAATLLGFTRSGTRKWELNLDASNSLGIWNSSTSAYATVVDSSSNFKFNSGYGSAATAYGCRAWVNFNAVGTVAIRGSGNVSSITDSGTGDYTVNFTNNMPDGNYSVAGIVTATGGGTFIICTDVATTYAVGVVRIQVTNNSGTVADRTSVNVAVFR